MSDWQQKSQPSGPQRPSLLDHTADSLEALFATWGEPAYRARQVLAWVYGKDVTDYVRMTNLSKRLRERLQAELTILRGEIIQEQRSSDGTIKRLLRWADGATSECVLIPDTDRRTACISSQVGCPVKCAFCASGLQGLQRQLSSGEIVEQILRVRELCRDDHRLSNIVFMGLGEPLANYAATVQAVRTIKADWGVAIGARKITVSTVGVPAQMRKLADEGMQITLALSLHAPNDELRRQIIPWAELVRVAELIEAANYYFDKTRREVTIEYILLGGLNDQPLHARELASVAKRMRCNINLIQYNPVSELPYRRPTDRDAGRFLDLLRERGINTHLRRSRGQDIDAACGQLRRRESQRVDLRLPSAS